MLRNKFLSILVLLFAVAASADAHTHLKSSTPAADAVLSASPAELNLQFSEPTRLTALTVQKEGESDTTAIQPLPKEMSASISVPLAALAPGKYKVSWRVIGKDNHVMSGDLSFTVKGN